MLHVDNVLGHQKVDPAEEMFASTNLVGANERALTNSPSTVREWVIPPPSGVHRIAVMFECALFRERDPLANLPVPPCGRRPLSSGRHNSAIRQEQRIESNRQSQRPEAGNLAFTNQNQSTRPRAW